MFPAISGAQTPGNAFSPIPVHSGEFSEQMVPGNMVFSAEKGPDFKNRRTASNKLF